MKKFLGVLIAVALCVCMVVPAAMAVDTGSLSDSLGGIDLGSLSDDKVLELLEGLNLDGFDTDSLKAALSGDSDASAKLDAALKNLTSGGSDSTGSTSSAAGGIGDVLSGLSGMIDPSSFSAISDALGGLIGGSGDGSSFDISSLMDTISGAFSGLGFDLGSLTEGFDPGSFDFASIISGITGGGDGSGSGNGAMDTMSGIMDTLMSGLSSLGIDTSAIEGLLDNDIVNFFANLYIGLGEIVKPDEEPSTTAPTTTKPAVVTTKTPKTGDTSAVFVALGTLTVAAAAAFVCLKKKKD